ncbi:MAG: molybdopterin-dependent oxidoreductase [Planctomycetota bacterium]|nr:molybdopterin-dependent oxidoreductase [Planctomycetota bacterium]
MRELPPNQAIVADGKWPVIGEAKPRASSAPWTLSVFGLVKNKQVLTLEDLRARPQIERTLDIHCVTRWSKLGARFRGIRLLSLLEEAVLDPSAGFVSFTARSDVGHNSSLKLSDLAALDPMIAFEYDGEALGTGHGGPMRLVVEGRYFYKSVKWLEQIELLAEDRLGTWEGGSGYHNLGDPWQEQRFMASGLSRKEMQKALSSGNLSGLEILSLLADHCEIEGLNAEGSLLRNASFRGSQLNGARFNECNLCNSHFQKAQLRGACFIDADLEGANFEEADLRGADFRGARLFGASFCSENGGRGALLDAHTKLELAHLECLSDAQRQFLKPWI